MKTDAIQQLIRISKVAYDEDVSAAASAELAAMEADNAAMREALETIASYDKNSGKTGICPYGCDTPHIAQTALALTPDSGKVCKWRQVNLWDEPDAWDTQCGETFLFGAGGPVEDGIDFCCYCGKKIVRIDAKSEEDDDDVPKNSERG